MSRGAGPRLMLSVRSLSGISLATRDRLLEVTARYREPESLAVTLSKAVDAGVDGILASPTNALRAAIAELPRPVPIYAVLPTLSEHDRHELEPGVEEVLARSWREAGSMMRMRLRLGGLMRPAMFFHGDLVARFPLLAEAETSRLQSRALRGVILDAWLTDLALATGNQRFFESYCRLIRRRYRVAAGFETNNLGLMLERLRTWGIRPDLVVGPVNPWGLMMKPSLAEVLEELTRSDIPVVAKDLRAGGVSSLADGARFARGARALGLAPDLTELDDVGTELRALSQAAAA